MRHQKAGKKFGRTSSHRKAMFRNMVTSLLAHERIITTQVKAKEIARLAEKMITLGKRGDLHARRQAVAFIRTSEAVKRLFSVYADRYKNRQGGYTRILKLEPRPGDNAPMAIVELMDRPAPTESKTAKPKAKEKAKKEAKTAAPKSSGKAGEKEAKGAKAAGSGKKAETVKESKPEKKTVTKAKTKKTEGKSASAGSKGSSAKEKKED